MAKVAKVSFIEVKEDNDQVGTLRFGFTDYNEIAADGDTAAAWAIPPSSALSGDICCTLVPKKTIIARVQDMVSQHYYMKLVRH